MNHVWKPCHCGSGLTRRDLKDARGIFCAFVCDRCEAERRSEFRPDIFTDPNYWASEPIEDESNGESGWYPNKDE